MRKTTIRRVEGDCVFTLTFRGSIPKNPTLALAFCHSPGVSAVYRERQNGSCYSETLSGRALVDFFTLLTEVNE